MTSAENNVRLIKKAIDDFHNKFFPEVKVSYIGQSKNKDLAFLFRGHFCLTCSVSDYFDDFKIVLNKHLKEEYTVSDKLPLEVGLSGWIVLFSPKMRETNGKDI
ncbi:MAG: hypothetical protein Q6351_001050 [Candidatus Njordarchaeum guaymaensis]